MRLTFLGTGGSEGYPGLFCDCQRCTIARQKGGRSIRRRSSMLVNDDLLVDFGPDVPAAAQQWGLSMGGLRHLFITHNHDDHFLPITLRYRTRKKKIDPAPLTVYGSQPTLDRLATIPFTFEDMRISSRLISDGNCIDAGDYRVLPLAANHVRDIDPLIYVIAQRTASVLYATDTAAFLDATWAALAELPRPLDAAVVNCALLERAVGDDDRLHMTLNETGEHIRRLRQEGILRLEGVALGTHFSHRSQPDHDTVDALLRPYGVRAAFDGLQVSLHGVPYDNLTKT